jgi:hypothetical protein
VGHRRDRGTCVAPDDIRAPRSGRTGSVGALLVFFLLVTVLIHLLVRGPCPGEEGGGWWSGERRGPIDFCSLRTGSANCGGRRRTPRVSPLPPPCLPACLPSLFSLVSRMVRDFGKSMPGRSFASGINRGER